MHPDAEALVKTLGLSPHPEGGFFRETWRSSATVQHPSGQTRAASTAIYFLLPAGTWQAAIPRGDRFALCGCTVAPGFDFADFEMPARATLLDRFPQHSHIVAKLTRA